MYLVPIAAQAHRRMARFGAVRTSARRRYRLGQAAAEPTAAQFEGSNTSAAFVDFLDQCLQTRLLPAPSQQNASTTCSATAAPTGSATAAKALKITSAAAGVGTSVTASLAAAGTIGSVVPIVGTIIGAIAGGLTALFTHHAQAEAMQSSVLCENVPAANALLQQIDAELASGQATPAQAASAYAQIQSQFAAALQSDPSYKTGDALWGFNQGMAAIVAQRNADLENGVLSSGAAAPWASGAGATSESIATSLGVSPSVLWIGAGLLALYLFTS